MTTDQFFQELLHETQIAFFNSPIYYSQKELGKQWSYSVCGTPIQTGKGILLGINWGADGIHNPQSAIPDGKDIITYKFIERSKDYLLNYLNVNPARINFNYANLCFFRSPKESDLTKRDYELSLPLFKQYVEFIQPPWIFSLGSSNSKWLQQLKKLKKTIEFPDNEGKFKGITGTLWKFPYFSVPHPNARVKSKSREEIWESIGKQFNSNNRSSYLHESLQ